MMTLNKAGEFAVGIAIVVAVALWKMLRFALFIVLMLGERIATPVLSFAGGMGLLGFVFCLGFYRHGPQLWAFLGLGLGSTALLWFYQALLMSVAPEGYMVITEQ